MLARGLALHQAGRLEEAEQCYRQVLQREPNHPDALHLLGLVLHQRGDQKHAADLIRRAIQSSPSSAAFHNSLGEVLRAQQRVADAKASFQAALRLQPDYAAAQVNLSLVLESLNDHEGAEQQLRSTLKLAPDFAPAHYNLGRLLFKRGQADLALASLDACLKLAPHVALAHNQRGMVLQSLGRVTEAIASLRQAIALEPDMAEAYFNLGGALSARCEYAAAIDAWRKGLRLDPQQVDAYLHLGAALKALGQMVAAVVVLDEYLRRKPDATEAYAVKAAALAELGRADEAVHCVERALLELPDNMDLLALQADCYYQAGDLATGLALLQACAAKFPDSPVLASSVLFHRAYDPGQDLKALYVAHRQWGRQFGAVLGESHVPGAADVPERKLRIGYVSPDFKRHPIGFLLEPVLLRHDRSQFEVYCYADVPQEDGLTQNFRAAAQAWRDISDKTDDEVAALVRSDAIDILVDLNGHTLGNRLLVFARKPAPLQVSWLGYFNTTGMDAMDYLIADEYSVPNGSPQQFAEEVLRMPHSRFCYAGPPEAPAIAALPALSKAYVTFGSFNHLAKLNASVIAVWSRILQAVPHSRLVLKRKQFADKTTRQRFMNAFKRNGIDTERIELRQGSRHLEMLEEYGDIDIALDPFPYTGGMTTLEALWMGVPVVTLTGESLLSRQSASFLRLIGLEQLVAQDEQAYCMNATQLAADQTQLAGLRAGLRARMLASSLCDCSAFVRELEQAYRQVWRRFCDRKISG